MDKNLALVLGIIVGLIITGFSLTYLKFQDQLEDLKRTQVIILKNQLESKDEKVMIKVQDLTFAIPLIATRLGSIEDKLNFIINSQSKKPQDLKIEVYQNGQGVRTFNSVEEALQFLKAFKEL